MGRQQDHPTKPACLRVYATIQVVIKVTHQRVRKTEVCQKTRSREVRILLFDVTFHGFHQSPRVRQIGPGESLSTKENGWDGPYTSVKIGDGVWSVDPHRFCFPFIHDNIICVESIPLFGTECEARSCVYNHQKRDRSKGQIELS